MIMSVSRAFPWTDGYNIPVTIRRHNIVDAQLLANLLNPQMRHVGVQLLGSHGRRDGGRQVHQARSLVVARIAPSVALAPLLGAVGVELDLSRLRAAAAFGLGGCGDGLGCCIVLSAKATAAPERDGVGARLAEIASPRHAEVVVDE